MQKGTPWDKSKRAGKGSVIGWAGRAMKDARGPVTSTMNKGEWARVGGASPAAQLRRQASRSCRLPPPGYAIVRLGVGLRCEPLLYESSGFGHSPEVRISEVDLDAGAEGPGRADDGANPPVNAHRAVPSGPV